MRLRPPSNFSFQDYREQRHRMVLFPKIEGMKDAVIFTKDEARKLESLRHLQQDR